MGWVDFEHVKRYEFLEPDHVSVETASAANETRRWLGAPMVFTRDARGNVWHPHGDAVAPDASSHSAFSLHKWGIAHSVSHITGVAVASESSKGVALDWHCPNIPLLDVYFDVERLSIWNGIGLYPYWRNPGLHTDLRERRHPGFGARWYQDRDGKYQQLDVAALKELCKIPKLVRTR